MVVLRKMAGLNEATHNAALHHRFIGWMQGRAPNLLRTIGLFLFGVAILYFIIDYSEGKSRPAGPDVTEITTLIGEVPEGAPPIAYSPIGYGSTAFRRGSLTVTLRGDIAQALEGLERPGLFITRARRMVSVNLQGQNIEPVSQRNSLKTYALFQPHLYEFPQGALQTARETGRAQITIEGRALEAQPFIGSIYVGEMGTLGTAYSWRNFLGVSVKLVAASVAFLTAIIAFGLSLSGGHRRILYLSFGLTMMCWCLISLRYTGFYSQFNPIVGRVVYAGASFLLIVGSLGFLNEWTYRARFIRKLLVPGLGGVFLIKILPLFLKDGGIVWSYLVMSTDVVAAICVVIMLVQLFTYMATQKVDSWLAGLIFLICILGVVADVAGSSFPSLARGVWPDTGMTLHFGPCLSIWLGLTIVGGFIVRFLESQRELASINATLSQNLAAKEAEIKHVYAQREAEVREAALMGERKRIMRDMHDGVGGRLLSLSLRAKRADLTNEALSAELDESLQELRLIVDSMDTADGDLELALGALRGRIEPLLYNGGITLDWDARELGEQPAYGPREVLSIYRIVQEATSNIIRHASATHMTFLSRIDTDGQIAIDVIDDGVGFDTAVSASGKGLSNIRTRALALGGAAQIGSRVDGQKGTQLQIRLPQG